MYANTLELIMLHRGRPKNNIGRAVHRVALSLSLQLLAQPPSLSHPSRLKFAAVTTQQNHFLPTHLADQVAPHRYKLYV